MQDVTVACSCGRTMGPDAMRGRGAYRCGCGVRVTLQLAATRPQCVAIKNGAQCRMHPATGEPVPLCPEHRKELVRVELNGLDAETVADELADRMWVSWMDLSTEGGIDREAFLAKLRRDHEERDAQKFEAFEERERIRREQEKFGVVYFIRMGEKIKIGTTTNLSNRLAQLCLPMSVVMATEQGSKIREAELHEQFARYREHGEWFRAESELLAYIETLK